MLLELLLGLGLVILLVVVPHRGYRFFFALLLIAGMELNLHPGLVYSFSPAHWKQAKQFRRRILAYDFLQQVSPAGMTLAEIQALLGEPDTERDFWMYNLRSDDKSVQPGETAEISHPQLVVSFRGGKAVNFFTTERWSTPSAQTPFEESAWRSSPPQVRAQMISALFHGPFVATTTGQDKQQIAALLGNPDERSPAKAVYYDLGVFHWIGEIWGKDLQFLVNDNGVVMHGGVLARTK